jgi:hypothetical protein
MRHAVRPAVREVVSLKEVCQELLEVVAAPLSLSLRARVLSQERKEPVTQRS